MRGAPWTKDEIEAAHIWVGIGNLSDYKAGVAVVASVNPGRPVHSIRNLLTRTIRMERPLTAALEKRIIEKWESLTKRYGDKTEPSSVCWNVSAFRAIPIGFQLFVKYSIEIGRLPEGSDWTKLLPKMKVCRGCGKERMGGIFRTDPSSCDGLGYYCSLCNIGNVNVWRIGKREATPNEPTKDT